MATKKTTKKVKVTAAPSGANLTLTVKSIEKKTSIEDNEVYLNVRVLIADEAGELLADRYLGFPLVTTQDELLAELKKYKTTFGSDLTQAEENAAFDTLHAEADKVISNVEGKEL